MQTDKSAAGGEFDVLVFIGRFQPYHLGHKQIIDEALRRARRVIVLVGSSNRPRSIRNPWTFEERQEMILGDHRDERWHRRLVVAPIWDFAYDDQAWIGNVQQVVAQVMKAEGIAADARVGLIGMHKDGTSYYLRAFPQWGSVAIRQSLPFDATSVRHQFLSKKHQLPREVLPESTYEILKGFMTSEHYARLVEEGEYLKAYKKQWAAAPYPPTFVTVDAVVVQSGHILLVRRGGQPGAGLLALPGGFLDQNETCEQGMVRELREETGLRVPPKVIAGSIKARRVFDDPWRSQRGRTVTHAFLIELEPMEDLPRVAGADDAESAHWHPLSQIDPKAMFEDHWDIIRKLVPAA